MSNESSKRITEWSIPPPRYDCITRAFFRNGKLYPSVITTDILSMSIDVLNNSNGNPDTDKLPTIPDHITHLHLHFYNNRVVKHGKKRSLIQKQKNENKNEIKKKQKNDKNVITNNDVDEDDDDDQDEDGDDDNDSFIDEEPFLGKHIHRTYALKKGYIKSNITTLVITSENPTYDDILLGDYIPDSITSLEIDFISAQNAKFILKSVHTLKLAAQLPEDDFANLVPVHVKNLQISLIEWEFSMNAAPRNVQVITIDQLPPHTNVGIIDYVQKKR